MSDCCAPVDTGQHKEASVSMESCCTPALTDIEERGATPQLNHCPACGRRGKKVDSITLKSMLKVSLLALREVPYLFCRTAGCPVVYFASEGMQSFTKTQIRVPVYQKEPNDEAVPVCYCFGHSPATIRAELIATGQSTVVKEINWGIKTGLCACEVRNPQGACCLGNVRSVVSQVRLTNEAPTE